MQITNLKGNNAGREGFAYLLCTPQDGTEYRLIMIQEGTGDNLLPEDRDAGYVDYINWYDVTLGEFEVLEGDGGMLLLETYISDAENGLLDFVGKIAEEAEIPEDWEIKII